MMQTPAGSIEGAVAKAINGEPLSKAIVELLPLESSATSTNATTSDDGKFAFRNVQPGRYKLVITRAGYVQPEYRPVVTVAAGERVNNLRFLLTQTGTIYGKIVDRNGRPMANAIVRALKPSYPDGRRSLRTEQTALTNDLGEYRLFWLTPGSYFLSAMPYWSAVHGMSPLITAGVEPKGDLATGVGSRTVAGLEGVSAGVRSSSILDKSVGATGPNETYVATYFPGTTDADRASSIKVAPGSDARSEDLTVVPVQTHRVRGVILNGITRRPAPRAQLRRARASASDVCATPGITGWGFLRSRTHTGRLCRESLGPQRQVHPIHHVR